MKVNVPSQGKEICYESLKEQYEESFTVILTILEYGEQDTIGSFISSVMN